MRAKLGNAAVRSRHHRYIRYKGGGEELYDHRKDPYEWNNLADDPKYAKIKAKLAKALPESWAEPAPTKRAFSFDPETFTWTNKKDGTIVHGK